MEIKPAFQTSIFTPKNVFGSLIFVAVAGMIWSGIFFIQKNTLPATVSTIVPSPYIGVSLISRAAYVLDGKTGKELWGFNENAQLPLASLTKIMTAATALSLVPENTVITINQAFLKSEGDSGLYVNEEWRLKDLLDLTLLESSNDGANAIARTAGRQFDPRQVAATIKSLPQENYSYDVAEERFVAAMNQKALQLGLTGTYFVNPTGLDESENVSGSYGSARDIATLFSYALHTYPKLFGATRYEVREIISLSSLKHTVKNTNDFVGNIPSLLCSKTGFTDLAGGNLVLAFDAGPDHPIIISVLGSTEQGRFEDAEKLVYATLKYLQTDNQ